MKVALMSDVHLEFGFLPVENTENADVCILAGDIVVANHFTSDCKAFFESVSKKFKHVVYIMGNHEHYKGDFAKSYEQLQMHLSDFKNVYLLEKESKEIEGHLFLGMTLWTNFNNENPLSMMQCSSRMNDFRVIKNSKYNRKLVPADVLEEHKLSFKFIGDVYDNNSKNLPIIVVGHHAPSKNSIKEPYRHDFHINGAYSSDLDSFIEQRPNIKLWVHGHTHTEFEYMIGDTQIVCNPRGYLGHERGSQESEPYYPKYIEV
jgi:predicted phosphodiesterase